MRPRGGVKHGHEDHVIGQFTEFINQAQGMEYQPLPRRFSEPPDAVLEDGKRYMWVEHADVYRSMEEAREDFSYATPGEETIPHTGGPIVEPNKRIAYAVNRVMSKKLRKESYREVYEEYGMGVLLLTVRDPLFSEGTLREICDFLDNDEVPDDLGYFRAVYLGIAQGDDFQFVLASVFPTSRKAYICVGRRCRRKPGVISNVEATANMWSRCSRRHVYT